MFETHPQRLLKPVNTGFVALSLLVAFLFNLLPWRDIRGVPDLVMVVLCFWCIQQPRLMGILVPFVCGLVMDAANGVLLGQHALAYSLLAFAAEGISRRMQAFGLVAQALHVLVLLLATQAIMLAVRLATVGTFPGWSYFLGSFICAALWPLITVVLLAPQRAADTDETATL